MTPVRERVSSILLSFHEAGHAVVAHYLNLKVTEIVVLQRKLCRVQLGNFDFDQSHFTPPKRLFPVFRKAMTYTVAGHVAVTLRQTELADSGYLGASPEERRAYRALWDFRISDQYRIGHEDNHELSDYRKVVVWASELCLADELGAMSHEAYFASGIRITKSRERDKRQLQEILKVEERAESILKRHWPAVVKVANAIQRAPAGVMKRPTFLKLVEK